MEITPNSATKFYCNICDFKCCKNVDWERHILTRKHTNRTMSNNLEHEITPNFTHNVFVCRKCNKEYKARNSLWYHEKKCNESFSLQKGDDEDIKNVIKEDNIKIEISEESSNIFEDIYIFTRVMTISVIGISIFNWSHKGNELAWNNPVKVAVFYSLIILIFFDIKCSKVIPAKSHSCFKSL